MRIEPGSEAGSMMLADLMLQKNEWEAAIYHFQQLLEATPAHFKAMVKLLQLLRRAGRLKEASRFLVQVRLRARVRVRVRVRVKEASRFLVQAEHNP